MDSVCESSNCGSRVFHVGDDGYTYCSEGHRQYQTGLVTAEDEEGTSAFGRKARKQRENEENQTTLTGREGFEHYLLCFQAVLWQQVRWLIEVEKLPAELEGVVRDLWALHLQTLQARITQDDTATERSSQLFSSQSEGETTDQSTSSRNRKKEAERLPRVLDALCLSYIGILLLRLPLTVADLHGWVLNGNLLYYRAVKALSVTMRSRLAGRYNNLLDPQDLLQPETLHKTVLDTVITYHTTYGMTIPPVNYRLCLYRFVYNLHLPLEVYAAVLRLSKMLNVDFTYVVEARAFAKQQKLRLADAQMIALLIVATKLLFPFDDRQRFPRKPTELAALSMNWAVWSKAHRERTKTVRSPDVMNYADAIQTVESDVSGMSIDKLDQYMDWYEKSFAEDHVKEIGKARKEAEFRRSLLRLFPVNRPASPGLPLNTLPENDGHRDIETDAQEEALRAVQQTLKPSRVVADEESDLARPGSFYKRYRNASELADNVKEFYEAAADMVGLSLESTVNAVFGMEKRLEHWEANARKDR